MLRRTEKLSAYSQGLEILYDRHQKRRRRKTLRFVLMINFERYKQTHLMFGLNFMIIVMTTTTTTTLYKNNHQCKCIFIIINNSGRKFTSNFSIQQELNNYRIFFVYKNDF